MPNKIFQKFRTFRIVEKDTDCRNTVAVEDSSSLKGFNPIIHSSALGFMAMFGKWRFGRAETLPCYGIREMIQEEKILHHEDTDLSVYALALGKRKISPKYM